MITIKLTQDIKEGNTVEHQYNKGLRDWKNLFAVRYNKVLSYRGSFTNILP